MRDLFFVGYLGAFLAAGFRKPFLFVLAYAYVTIVAPQRLSYYLLNSIPVVMIVAVLAIGGWLLTDDKRDVRVPPRVWMTAILLLYCGYTTIHADLPVEAWTKWEWVWKALLFGIFLPLTLRTKLRVESFLLFMILSVATIIVTGGIKTVLSGGGYGTLALMVDNNSGLYEGSTISTVAVMVIPLILWLMRHGTIFPPDWRVRTFGYALVFACLLMPVGTEARTGLVCVAVLGLLMLREVKRRLLYLGLIGLAGLMTVPFLPSSFTDRMGTIQTYEADASATTRIAVWAWTWDYVKDNPMGGGFEAYRQNRLYVPVVDNQAVGQMQRVETSFVFDAARAYHSSYFEMLGEQGFFGLALFLAIHLGGVARMEILRRRYRGRDGPEAWIAPLAAAFQNGQIVFLVGSLFVGIAFQPFIWLFLGAQIGFDAYVTRTARRAARRPLGAPAPVPA